MIGLGTVATQGEVIVDDLPGCWAFIALHQHSGGLPNCRRKQDPLCRLHPSSHMHSHPMPDYIARRGLGWLRCSDHFWAWST
jgi:hypothetical protein